MTMIIRSKIPNFNYIEDIAEKLTKDDTILLPNNIKNSVIGFEASFIQLLVTWKRSHNQAKIQTYIKKNDTPATPNISSKLYALIAFYLADDIYFYGKEEGKIDRKTILSYYTNMINTMNRPYEQNNNHINVKLVSIQGAKTEYIKTLFDSPGRTRNNLITRLSFEKLTKKIVNTNKSLSIKIGGQEKYITNISHILYEALLNTVEHGYTNTDSIEYERNVRGVILKEHRYSEYTSLDRLIESDKKNDRFRQYLQYCKERFKTSHNSDHQKHLKRAEKTSNIDAGKQTESYSFLELSVFDGGCGIAHRLSGKQELTPEEERRYCEQAFKKHIGSKNTAGYGIGLSDIWNTLIELNAFIKIRTGRVSLYQTFHDNVEKNQPTFQDWHVEGNLQKMEGSVLTILIPIFNKESA